MGGAGAPLIVGADSSLGQVGPFWRRRWCLGVLAWCWWVIGGGGEGPPLPTGLPRKGVVPGEVGVAAAAAGSTGPVGVGGVVPGVGGVGGVRLLPLGRLGRADMALGGGGGPWW